MRLFSYKMTNDSGFAPNPFGCNSDIDSSRGTCLRKRHYVVRNHDFVTIGLGEQCPRLVEARTLQQCAQRQDGLPTGAAPSHSGALEPLRDQRLAGGLDDAGADGQITGLGVGVAHAMAVAPEVCIRTARSRSGWRWRSATTR